MHRNRTPRPIHCLLLATAGLLWAASTGAAPPRGPDLRMTRVVGGLESPVHLTTPAGDPRLFVVEQRGRIRIIRNGRLEPVPFLDITDRVSYGGERGLLSVAFHPGYARNGFFFVNYTDRRGDTRIERYRVGPDSSRADPGSGTLVLAVDQPYSNHNGGHILFGPDGMLWIGMGDGGSANDPHGHGQDAKTLLGDMLRIDVDRGDPYSIPPDNPFAHSRDARPEIWATGLRNPWRFWIDAQARLLYIADVGQNRWEEVHVVPLHRPGPNFGWNLMEGNHPLRRPVSDPRFTPAVLEYHHDHGCSITGGVVYRGRRIPEIQGLYFYSDYCRGWLRSFRVGWDRTGGGSPRATEEREWSVGDLSGATSFGVDAEGEMYVLVHSGTLYRLDRAQP